MRKFLLIVVLTAFMGNGVKAQLVSPGGENLIVSEQPVSEYAQTLKRFMEASGILKMFNELIPQTFGMLQKKFPNVPAAEWEQLQKANTPATLIDNIIKAFVPVYEKVFTKADLEELIKFYETPLGKKMAAAQPLIIQGTNSLMGQVQRPILQKVHQYLMEKGYISAPTR